MKTRTTIEHSRGLRDHLFISLTVFMLVLAGASYSQDDVTDDWVCPIDPAFDYITCMDVMANDPGYLSYEDSLKYSGPDYDSPPSIDSTNSCTYNSGGLYWECDGTDGDDIIKLGSIYYGSTRYPAICVNNQLFTGYTDAYLNFIRVHGYEGTDTIEVDRYTSPGETCQTVFSWNAWDLSWNIYLVAYGGGAGDMIYGSDKDDSLYGNDGNDFLLGYGGDDYLWGGKDTDNIYCGNSNGHDSAIGYDGMDFIRCDGYSGYQYIYGGNGYDYVYTGLDGSYTNDTSATNDGNYTIGGPGPDKIKGDNGIDTISGGWGHDEIWGYGGDDEIWGDPWNDGDGGGNDHIWGGNGNDTIAGQGGGDTIYGEAGMDCLVGGYLDDEYGSYSDEGSDIMDGGISTDCVYCDSVWISNYPYWCHADDSWGGGTADQASNCYDGTTCDCEQDAPNYCNLHP
jgi:Ca2+-binding RTX toxin-like protein